MEDIQQIIDLLAFSKDIIIFSHRNPDGDAIGSSLALKLYLEKIGHKVDVIFPSEFPSVLTFLAGTDDIIISDFEKDRSIELIKKCDLIFFLDFSSLDRIDTLGEHVIATNVPKVLIDHHLDPEPFADFIISDTTASSTSEIVYRFFRRLDNCVYLDKKIAESLLTGIISDTGSFKYSTNSETFLVASKLMEEGIDISELQNKIYNSLSEKQLRLIGYSINQRMEIIPEYETAIITLSKQDYKDYEILRGDTEGLVNYLLMMKNVKLAALITEQPTIVKISLRSKGDISVQEIARKHFKGGGHKNAAGGQAFAKLEDVVARFKSVLPNHLKN
ncbi:MAG: DHH family phosphoesterase [Deltaproteobacteria bacterium]